MNRLLINCYNSYTIYRKLKPFSFKENTYKELSKLYRKLKSKENVYLMRTSDSSISANKNVNIGEVIRLKSINDNVRFTGDDDETYYLLEFSLVVYYIVYNQEEIEVCDTDLLYISPDKEEQIMSGSILDRLCSIYDMNIKVMNKLNTNNVQTTTWSSQLNSNSVYIVDVDGTARMINANEWEVIEKEQLLFLSDIQKVKYLTERYDKGNIKSADFIKEVKKIVSM